MKYIAITTKGLEEITAKELNGVVIAEKHVLFSKLKKSKTSNTIFQLLDSFKFKDIKEIEKRVDKIKISFKKSFRVECLRYGSHNFKSVEVEREVGKILFKKGNKVDLKNPNEIFFVSILNDLCFFGVLKYDNLCKREYRVKRNNQSINACVAYSLLLIAGIKKSNILLDPFCKDAVIPIEASLMGIKKIHALDSLKNNIRNATINIKMAKVRNINLGNFDVSWLDTKFKKESVDFIITNLFISKREKEPEKIVKEFFYQSNFIVKKKIILITNKPDLIKEFLDKFKIEKEMPIAIGEMYYTILDIKKEN